MEERKKYLIALGGGSGTRFGSDVPKQFLPLGGVPILQRSISAFTAAVPGIKVITVLPSGETARWKELCQEHVFNTPQIIVAGGITRFHSVRAALEKVPDGALVAIHDGVRPLVSSCLIKDMFAAMAEHRALIPALPVTDTLKFRETPGVGPDRSGLVAVQTPQIFRSEDIRAAYFETGYREDFTDDASVAAAFGIPVDLFPGEKLNFKITTPEDQALAELLVR